MNDLLHLLTEPLQEGLQTQILERFRALQLESEDPLDRLRDTVQDFPELEDYSKAWWLEPALCGWWLCLYVDWKASDEVQWQIQAIARTLALPGRYVWNSQGLALEQAQVPDALEHASHWLRWREHVLLLLETGGDECMALVIHHDRLERVRILLEQVGISSNLI